MLPKEVASLSYMDFKPLGYIPHWAIEKFKKENNKCLILQKKDGRYTINLQALEIPEAKFEVS